MGKKGKNLNPADQHRKAMRKKELKKNKEKRKQQRENALIQKDPVQLRQQIAKIEHLEQQGIADKRLKTKKRQLEQQHEQVVKIKKDLRIAPTLREYEEALTMTATKTVEELERENLEKFPNPEESLYYHPTLNPFGAPPPGLPAMFRPGSDKAQNRLTGTGGAALPGLTPLAITAEGETSLPIDEGSIEEIDLDSIPLPPGTPPPIQPPPTAPLPPLPLGPPPSRPPVQTPVVPPPPGIAPPLMRAPPAPVLIPQGMPMQSVVHAHNPPIMTQPHPSMYYPHNLPEQRFGQQPPQPLQQQPPQPLQQQPPQPPPMRSQIPEDENEMDHDPTILIPRSLLVRKQEAPQPKPKVSKPLPSQNSVEQKKRDEAYEQFMKSLSDL